MQTTAAAPGQRTWMAHISACLGAAALLGVLSFHFPDLTTGTTRVMRTTWT